MRTQHCRCGAQGQTQDLGPVHQSVGRRDVLRPDGPLRLPDGGLSDQRPKIAGIPGQPDPQRPGTGRLRLSGVGGLVLTPVPAPDPQCVPPPESRQQSGGQAHEQGGQPGWQIIGRVVGAGRSPAEKEVSLVSVSHHGVHGIDSFVHHAQGQPAQSQPEQGSDHAVRGVFCHRLHCGPGHAVPVQALGIPSYNAANRPLRVHEAPAGQGPIHRHTLIPEAPGGQQLIAEPDLRRSPRRRREGI